MVPRLPSSDLLRAWVLATLGGLATDDEHHARLRDTLLVFLQSGGSYKTTAEQLVLHKNTVQYRIARPRRAWACPPPGTATTWNSRCRPAGGSAQPCCSRPGNDQQPRQASARPGSASRIGTLLQPPTSAHNGAAYSLQERQGAVRGT